MSRIGGKAIALPKEVKVQIGEQQLTVQGPKGKLTTPVPPGISFAMANGELVCKRSNDERQQRDFHGLARALAMNAVKGVTDGFSKELDIVGVGYKAELRGNRLVLALGYSHTVDFVPPPGVEIKVERKQKPTINQYQTSLIVSGIDRQVVGQTCANLRDLRRPDAYKGKGVRYAGVQYKLKPGKAAK